MSEATSEAGPGPDVGLEVGLDVGGTSVKAWVVTGARGARVATAERERPWGAVGFRALELADQRAGAPPTPAEQRAAAAIVDLAAELVAGLVEEAGRAALVRLGIATAGPKTTDRRGIALWRRGPRCPDLLDRLLEDLARRGCAPLVPPALLHDDSLAALRGERLAAAGCLGTDVRSALLLAPGTDLAEAYLLDGDERPRPTALAPAWELADGDRGSFGETVVLGPGVDVTASLGALGRLARLRLTGLAELGLPAPEVLVVGARGGALLVERPELGQQLAAELAGRLPVRASGLRAAAAIGALG
jgi:hypothetical protein